MHVAEQTVSRLADIAGIELPEEDVAPLAGALAAHLEAFRAVDAMDLGDTDQAVVFDPRWDG